MAPRIYSITDIDIHVNFIQLPVALFLNPKYKTPTFTNDARILYAFLRNRMMLSKTNQWFNADGEVYILCSRDEIGLFLGISGKTVTNAFKSLTEHDLIIETRQGLGKPNLIYVCHPEGIL